MDDIDTFLSSLADDLKKLLPTYMVIYTVDAILPHPRPNHPTPYFIQIIPQKVVHQPQNRSARIHLETDTGRILYLCPWTDAYIRKWEICDPQWDPQQIADAVINYYLEGAPSRSR